MRSPSAISQPSSPTSPGSRERSSGTPPSPTASPDGAWLSPVRNRSSGSGRRSTSARGWSGRSRGTGTTAHNMHSKIAFPATECRIKTAVNLTMTKHTSDLELVVRLKYSLIDLNRKGLKNVPSSPTSSRSTRLNQVQADRQRVI
ncbi:protein of unknown function [Methanoculleus bourgensis]|uniref:Uncharacterized protein n=1 Tax=Methanoculleus bourgensis TaxID=83986 RepID=A0A0X3BJG6_9EURY|nr:protein of unknown function [Methanoculleus bourgensis]